jgi:hypothetical protein
MWRLDAMSNIFRKSNNHVQASHRLDATGSGEDEDGLCHYYLSGGYIHPINPAPGICLLKTSMMAILEDDAVVSSSQHHSTEEGDKTLTTVDRELDRSVSIRSSASIIC